MATPRKQPGAGAYIPSSKDTARAHRQHAPLSPGEAQALHPRPSTARPSNAPTAQRGPQKGHTVADDRPRASSKPSILGKVSRLLGGKKESKESKAFRARTSEAARRARGERGVSWLEEVPAAHRPDRANIPQRPRRSDEPQPQRVPAIRWRDEERPQRGNQAHVAFKNFAIPRKEVARPEADYNPVQPEDPGQPVGFHQVKHHRAEVHWPDETVHSVHPEISSGRNTSASIKPDRREKPRLHSPRGAVTPVFHKSRDHIRSVHGELDSVADERYLPHQGSGSRPTRPLMDPKWLARKPLPWVPIEESSSSNSSSPVEYHVAPTQVLSSRAPQAPTERQRENGRMLRECAGYELGHREYR